MTLRRYDVDLRLSAARADQFAGQFYIESVAGAVGDHMPGEVEPAQRQVADQVEHLVPGRFVGEPQAVADRAARAEHDQIGRVSGACPTPCSRKDVRLANGHERAARCHFADELAGRDINRERLPRDRCHSAVIEEVTCPQRGIGRGVQGDGRAASGHDNRFGYVVQIGGDLDWATAPAAVSAVT